MRTSLLAIFVCSFQLGYSYETDFAKDMWLKASSMETEKSAEFMLDNYYAVFNKSFIDGIEWLEKALELSEKSGNQQLIGRSHLSLGTNWYLKGDYEKCIVQYQEALDIFESSNDQKYIGRTCNELSVYYRKQKQYDKSLEQLDRSFEVCNQCGDMECVETSLNNRGVVYEMKGEFDLAATYYHKAKDIAIENNNEIGLSYIYNNLAELYRITEHYDSTKFYIDKSTEIRIQLNDQQGIAINWTNLGEMYFEMKDYDEASRCLIIASDMAKDIGFIDLLRHCYDLLYQVYKEQGDNELALYYQDQSVVLKDSLLNIEKINSLSEMEVKYETEKTEKELAEESKKRVESELALANRNNWIIGILGLALALFFLILFLYQRKLKISQTEKDQEILKEKERGIEAVFEATEEERQRIAKDLHDGVGQQMSGIKMAWENISSSIKERNPEVKSSIDEVSKILDEAADEVRSISHQMMPKTLEELGLIPALNEMLDKSLKFTKIKYNFEHFNINSRIEKRIEISLYRISQELLNNIIKHSEATNVSVQLFKNKNQLILIVEDNGKGFEMASNDGHGLLNIKSRLNTIHGEVNYDASTQKGTIATVRINLTNS